MTEGLSSLRYVSTRGSDPVDFRTATLAGLAPDGGLFMPDRWPESEPLFQRTAGAGYVETAAHVLTELGGDSLPISVSSELAADAYQTFTHPEVAPVRRLRDGLHLLELFHGPTLAFKDFALQVLARLFDRFLELDGRRALVLCATSGDTGAAAIEACRGRRAMAIVVLHPEGRIAPLQRRLMTTVDDPAVFNVAIEGTFDSCQSLVKQAFADEALRRECGLLAVNSINWSRIAAQAAYYVHAANRIGGPPPVFAVPSGNFGDCYAGHVAACMGLGVAGLIVGTNRNDILARFFETGRYHPGTVHRTLSPAMDIQVASNFERLLYEIRDRDPDAVQCDMAGLARGQAICVTARERAATGKRFKGSMVTEDQTIHTMLDIRNVCGVQIDPHTAVGIAAARQAGALDRNYRATAAPVIALATAHPAKFPDAVRQALNEEPETPEPLARCMDAPERVTTLPADYARLADHLRRAAAAAAPAP